MSRVEVRKKWAFSPVVLQSSKTLIADFRFAEHPLVTASYISGESLWSAVVGIVGIRRIIRPATSNTAITSFSPSENEPSARVYT